MSPQEFQQSITFLVNQAITQGINANKMDLSHVICGLEAAKIDIIIGIREANRPKILSAGQLPPNGRQIG